MTYTVVWRPNVEKRLAELWLDARDRQRVTTAADAMEALLKSSPSEVGESREGATRILTVAPLSIYYDVVEADCLVVVWAVWTTSDSQP